MGLEFYFLSEIEYSERKMINYIQIFRVLFLLDVFWKILGVVFLLLNGREIYYGICFYCQCVYVYKGFMVIFIYMILWVMICFLLVIENIY